MRGHMAFRPDIILLNTLEDVLMRSSEGISPGERELIATYVSSLNDCLYYQGTHGSAAAGLLDGNEDLVVQVKSDYKAAPISEKLKALLAIAALVQNGGKSVTVDAVASARREGATDLEIHDTVLIAAAFCMYNRYVDGLGTWADGDLKLHRIRGADGTHKDTTKARLEPVKPAAK